MELTFCPLYSGSSGNALYCGYGDTRLLIDAGLSGKTVLGALSSIGINPGTLSGILITHEHSDHVSGAGVLARKLGIPIYANAGTWAAMEGKIGHIDSRQRRVFCTGEDFYMDDINIMPFKTPHDAAESVGFYLESHGRSVCVATDIGHMTEAIYDYLKQADIVLLESNHDREMLRSCSYAPSLKKRIAGKDGHLSNDECAKTLLRLCAEGVKTAILGHLSGEANTPDTALRASEALLAESGERMRLSVALRREIGRMCRVL